MDINIREFEEKDIKEVLPLLEDMYLNHDLAEPKLFNPNSISKKQILKELKEILLGKEVLIFVAELNGKVIGTIRVGIKDSPVFYKERKLGYTDDLVVVKEFQRKGIGTKLKYRAIEYLKFKGVKLVECKIYEFNKASQGLAESLGYKKTFSYFYKYIN